MYELMYVIKLIERKHFIREIRIYLSDSHLTEYELFVFTDYKKYMKNLLDHHDWLVYIVIFHASNR